MAAQDLFALAAADLLATTIDVLGADAPETAFVSIGPPVAPLPGQDCYGQLTVSVNGNFSSRTPLQRDSTGNQLCNVVTVVPLTITLYQCSPTITDRGAVDVADVNAQALDLYRVASKLWFGVIQRGLGAFPSFPGLTCNAINWGALSPGSNQGGIAGLSWTLQVSVG